MGSANEFDPVDELLVRQEVGTQHEALRRKVLDLTAPVLKRRRIVRRCAWGAAFLGCYLLGAASIALWHSWTATNEAVATGKSSEVQPVMSDSHTGGQESGTAQSAIARASAPERKKTRFEELRDAGDRACQYQQDLPAAIEFYAQALAIATPEELKISRARDSWLLMSLKEAHLKENTRVETNEKS